MKAIRFFAITAAMAFIAITSPAQSTPQVSTGNPAQEIVYEEIKIPRYREGAPRPTFMYINNQWVPNSNMWITPQEITSIEVKPNEYDNRSIYFTVNDDVFKRVLEKVKEMNVDSILNIEPTWMFSGGNWRLHYWLKDNIHLPKDYKGSTRAMVGFKVSLDGSVSDAVILRSTGNKELDDEALRVVNSMPNFIIEAKRPDTPPFYLCLPIDFTSPDVIFIR